MKIIIVSPKNRTIVNFRGDLIRDMVARGHDVIAIGADDGFEKEIMALGARLVMLPMKKDSISICHDLSYCCNLMSIFRTEKPDLVFGYTIKPVIYGSIAARICGVKKIFPMVTGLGYVFIDKSRKTALIRLIVLLLYKIAFRCANTVIFLNPDDMRTLTQYGTVRFNRCALVNGSGVNMSYFTRAPLPGTLTFFMLSRVMRNKGVMEYLQAARVVKRQYPAVRCKLLGALENMADSLTDEEISGYIEDGTIEYSGETGDVRPHFADCSVYVLPSYREGIPRTVLEAMATGRPIITTDAPGCRETVVDGKNGFLVPVRDANAVAEKMIWFITHPEKIAEFGARSHQLCSERYDVCKVNAAMLQIMGAADSAAELEKTC